MRARLFFVGMTIVLGLAAVAEAQTPDPARDLLTTIFSGEPVAENLFAPSFLAIVPVAQINAIMTQTLAIIGAPESIEPTPEGYLVKTATHDMPVLISLDADGKIVGLLLQPALETGREAEAILGDMKGLAEQVAYVVLKDGEVVHDLNAEEPLAVGSAFKLGVLAALKDEIDRGERAFPEVTALEARQLSLPSGMIQTFPVGSPLTLHTLAALMISISDNTATDVLIDLVGREAIAQKLGIDFVIKTRELFLLKQDQALRERFLAADAAGKAAIASEMDGMTVSMQGAGSIAPLTPGVEWYVPLTRLCALMAEVAALDVTQISPGPAGKLDWAVTSYKGGSEVGVMNLTTQVTGKDGSVWCAAVTFNGPVALDEARIATLYATLMASLAKL